jgi:hypothetical protein
MRCMLAVLMASLTAAAVEPTDDIILFEGPVPGAVAYRHSAIGDLKTEAGTVQFVTKDAVYLRTKTGSIRIIDTKTYLIAEATATQDKRSLVWLYDASKKELRGTIEPIRAAVMPPSTVPAAGETLYLYFALDRLNDRIEQAVHSIDREALKQLRDRATVLSDRAKTVAADFQLIEEFSHTAKSIDEFVAIHAARQKYLDEHIDKVERNQISDAEAKLRSEMERQKGVAEYYRGAFPRVSVNLRSGQSVASYDMGGAMAGVALMTRAELMYEHDRLRIAHAKRLLDKDKAAKLDEFAAQSQTLRDTRRMAIATLGHDVFGMPRAKDVIEQRALASTLIDRSDYAELSRVMNGRNDSDKHSRPAANPFAIVNTLAIAAQVPERDRAVQSERLFRNALAMIECIRLIPGGTLYDPDRADILRSAAGLAILAAVLESPDGSWKAALSPKAAFAVRLLNRAGEITIDMDGQIREQKAVAAALSGRYPESLKIADEIRLTRSKVIPFLITYARLQSLNDHHKDGLSVLGDAIGLGYDDIGFIAKNEDFIPLRRDAALFKAYTKPQLTFNWVLPKPGLKMANASRIELVNNSPFALTKLRLQLRVDWKGAPDKPLIKTIDVPRIDKTDQYVWEAVFDDAPARVAKMKLTVDSDQGQFITDKPNVK